LASQLARDSFAAFSSRENVWKLCGKRIRENFKTHAEAVTRKQELEVQAANVETAGQTVFTRLTPDEVNQAEAAFARLKRIGHGTLLGLVDFYERNYRDPLKRISLSDAADRFKAEKKSANRRERYLKDLDQELGYLTKEYGNKPVHEIQKEDMVDVIAADGRGAERQNNIRKDYRTFFNWCLANGYAQSSPAELVPVKTVERGEIATLSVDTVRKLMGVTAGYKGGKDRKKWAHLADARKRFAPPPGIGGSTAASQGIWPPRH
jgi:hypothetical protein